MMGKYKEVTAQEISDFKVLVSRCLTPETSAILLDPEYGLALLKIEHRLQVCYLRMKNGLRCFDTRTVTR